MENNKVTFEYTYSASQQEEIEKIRRKYLPKEDDKLTQLKKLDAAVTKPGTIAGIALGVIGCLIFGSGMSCCMLFTEKELTPVMLLGIVLGILGILLIALAYPVYVKITEREKKRIAPQILALTEELFF